MPKSLLLATAALLLPSLLPAQGFADNLVVEGVPAIPPALAERVGRYQNFRGAGLTDWHPTKREVLVATRFADTSQLHAVAMPMGMRRQMTFFADPVGGSWCPSGDCLVLSKGDGGNEQTQFYRLDTGSGEITLLTDGKSRNGALLWSRKGDRFAFASTARNGKDTDIYLMSPRGGPPKLLLQVNGTWSPQDWSFDDQRLTLLEYVSANESRLHVLDVATGKAAQVTVKSGDEKVSYDGALFARDGKSFYTGSDKGSEFHRLVRFDLATGKETPLTAGIPWDVEEFTQSRDGRMIAFTVNADGFSVLHLLDTATGRERPAPKIPAGQASGLQWKPDGRELGFVLNGAKSASDVFSLEIATGKVTRWTESEAGGLNTSGFSEPELIRYRTFDGPEISAIVYRAAAKFTGPRPVIIDIHGGPEGQSRPGFRGRWNYFSEELGVTVVAPNVRGSTGYGKTFLALDNGMKRENSVKDIGALLDWIKTRPDMDAGRVMVTGGSYGGYMTLASLTHFSDRLRCGIDIVGPSNLITFLKNTAEYRRDLRRAEYGDERDPAMAAVMEQTAPLNNTDKIQVPLFVVQGKNDPRVPYTEAEQMVAKVRALGKPVWYLMAKDEGHGFAKKKNSDTLFYAEILFVQEYLLK